MKRLLAVVAIAALALALTACAGQKSEFSDDIDDDTGAYTITAENGAKGSALGSLGGGIALEEGQVLIVKSDLTKGSVGVKVLDEAGEAVVDTVATGTDQQLFGFPAGKYSFGATCEEDGTTGTVVVVAVDERIYSECNGDLEVTLAQMKAWPKAASAEEAAKAAGLDGFTVPDGDIGLQNGPVNFMGYAYAEGAVEAYGGVGAAEAVVYKSAQDAGIDIPANDTEYKFEWTDDVDGVTVSCSGNVEGQAMKAAWTANGSDYVMLIRGQGDMYDTFGLAKDDVAKLVSAIK